MQGIQLLSYLVSQVTATLSLSLDPLRPRHLQHFFLCTLPLRPLLPPSTTLLHPRHSESWFPAYIFVCRCGSQIGVAHTLLHLMVGAQLLESRGCAMEGSPHSCKCSCLRTKMTSRIALSNLHWLPLADSNSRFHERHLQGLPIALLTVFG